MHTFLQKRQLLFLPHLNYIPSFKKKYLTCVYLSLILSIYHWKLYFQSQLKCTFYDGFQPHKSGHRKRRKIYKNEYDNRCCIPHFLRRLELNRRNISQQTMPVVWLFEDRTFNNGCGITVLERFPYYAGWKLDCLNISVLQLDFLRRLLYNRRNMFNRLRRLYNNHHSI